MVKLAHNAMNTVETLKIMLSLSYEDTSYDDYLVLLINYASSWLESMTGRSFGLKQYNEAVAGSGQQELVLKQYPIREIGSIKDKESGLIISQDTYSFNEDGDIGVVFKDSGWQSRAYPTGLVPDYIHTRKYLQVEYTAGYVLPKDFTDDTPEDWKLPANLQGIVAQIAEQELALQDSGAAGLSAFSISDVSWTFDKAPRQNWIDVINSFKRVV